MLLAMAATYALWIKRSALSGAVAVVAVLLAFKFGAFSLPRAEAMPLIICFFSGVLICLLGREISFSKWLACGLIFLLWLSSASTAFASIAVIAILVIGLYVSTLPAVKWIRLPGDYSYGVYLYGFFIQQCLKAAYPALDLPTHQLLSMLIAVICGALSWHLVEQPAMLFWKRFAATQAAR